MNCNSCNAEIAADVIFCGNCGARQVPASDGDKSGTALDPESVERLKVGAQAAAKIAQGIGSQVGKSSIVRGIFVLIISFFTMPFKTMTVAGRLLREIGKKGALSNKTDQPHLTWFATALPVCGTLIFFGIVIYGLWASITVPSELFPLGAPETIPEKIGTMIGFYLGAVIADWVFMFLGELFILTVHMSQYMRSLLDETRSQSAALRSNAESLNETNQA